MKTCQSDGKRVYYRSCPYEPMKELAFTDALSEEMFSNLLINWSSVSKHRESGSIYVYHKGIMLRRHEALLRRPDLTKEYFHGDPPVLIDIESGYFEDNESIEQEFLKHELNGTHPVYWICGIDQLLLGKSDSFFHYLRQRQAKDPSISYVLFFTTDFLHPSVRSILTDTSTFLQNVYITPLFDEKTGEYFLNYLVRKWNVQMSRSLQKDMLYLTSRHFLLLKQAVRYVRDTQVKFLESPLQQDMMRIKLKSIYDSLLPTEQSVLSKIIAGANDFSPDETASIDFLKKTRWIESAGNRLHLTIPLLAQYIASLHISTKRIESHGGRLMIGATPIDTFWSAQEKSVLLLLVEHTGQTVARDAIAKALWGENWGETYSDWAIDQLMSRIRRKCVELDLPRSTVQAIKGKGFCYAQ